MRLSLSFLLGIISLMALGGNKVPAIINRTPFEVTEVRLTDSATVLTMVFTGAAESIVFPAEPYLFVPEQKNALLFKHGHIHDAARTPLSTSQVIKPGDVITMFFDPAPQGNKILNYYELDLNTHRLRTIVGIRTDGAPYRGSLFPPADRPRRDRLPAYSPAVDRASLEIDMMMPRVTYGRYKISNIWADDNTGYDFDIDSASRGEVSTVHFLPTQIDFNVNDIPVSWLAIPGSRTKIIFDAPGYAELRDNGVDHADAYNRSLHVYDSALPEVYSARTRITPRWMGMKNEFFMLPFDEYIDSARMKMTVINQEIVLDTTLSGAEKEYLKIVNERNYINNRSLYALINRSRLSDDEKEFFESGKYMLDEIAPSLITASSPAAIYVYGSAPKDILPYLKINSLTDTPLYKDLERYFSILDSVTEQRALLEADRDLGIMTLPDCAPENILDSIVARHKGKTLLIDFWATWCGPCLRGMSELEPYKEDLSGKGVDFVYITDESSPDVAWREKIADHHGSHYLIISRLREQMNIPGFNGSIPFYLIYRPDGSLAATQTGYDTDALLKKIDEAISH